MFSHLVIEVVERRFVFREMAEITFRKVPYPQLIPENDKGSVSGVKSLTGQNLWMRADPVSCSYFLVSL